MYQYFKTSKANESDLLGCTKEGERDEGGENNLMVLNGLEQKPKNSPAFSPLCHRARKQTLCRPMKAIFLLAIQGGGLVLG